MHEMQTIITDVRSVCQSVCHAAQLGFTVWGHSVQPLPNHFGLLFYLTLNLEPGIAFERVFSFARVIGVVLCASNLNFVVDFAFNVF